MKKAYPKLSETKLEKNTVIIRANLNLKFKNGEIDDDSKIKSLIPTLNYLQKANCKTIILSHLGNECSEYRDDLSLLPLRFAIGRHLNKPIKFVSINSCQNSIKFMEFGDILLLENLCFSPEEFSTDKKVKEAFMSNIAQFAEYYIDESFGVSQNLASTSVLPKMLNPLLGLNFEEELKSISIIKKANREGFLSLIGGNATENKLMLIEKLLNKSEKILLGGEIANLFIAVKEKKPSKFSKEHVIFAKKLLKTSKETKCEIILPVDVVLNNEKTIDSSKIGATDNICDIGPKTILQFQEAIEKSRTLIINGTMGIYEEEKFWKGTNDVFEIAALISPKEIYKVIGGEDTMEAVKMLKIKNKKFNHITSGFAEFILSI